jgi:chemotaxis signal transduction protein
MDLNANKDGKADDPQPSLEALIKSIDQQVDQVPALSTAEGFAAFLGGTAADYQRKGEKYVRFFVNNTAFALPLENTLEINYVPEVIPLPNLPQWVLGICNLRGDIVSVVDIKQILQLEPEETDTIKKLILIQNKDVSTAIIVDNLAGILFTNDRDDDDGGGGGGETKTIAESPFSKFVKDVIIADRQSIHLLDLDGLMAALKI